MGKFTTCDNPKIDHVIESHMQQIVAGVRSRMEPHAIILRGSFGRGEGSVLIEDDHLRFLSDYEINVVTPVPFYRALLARLQNRFTTELNVETSLSWIRPNFFYKNRVGPFSIGPAQVTIFLYETRYGSQTLYGQDILNEAPPIDPRQIPLSSGIQLLLNRMTESLHYISRTYQTEWEELRLIKWINKNILACVEALLLSWGQYHFSYRERGRRFAALAREQLAFMGNMRESLAELAVRAIEFKVHPRRELYPAPIQEAWTEILPICDRVFRQLVCQEWGIVFGDYEEFPEQYLRCMESRFRSYSLPLKVGLKLLDAYKFARKGCPPLGIFWPYTVPPLIYAVVPLLFFISDRHDKKRSSILTVARQHLAKACSLGLPASNLNDEWHLLNDHMFLAWNNFCT